VSKTHDEPLTKQALETLFKTLERQKLQPSKLIMDESTFHELTGKHCERCNGYYNKDLPVHPMDACDLEIARRIMEC